MNYIVFDMEWNQPFDKKHIRFRNGVRLTGEIIQIGAVRLDEKGKIKDTFDVRIHPQKYTVLSHMVKKVTGFTQRELRQGIGLNEAIDKFKSWCGRDFILFTWGPNDLPMLKDNLKFFSLDYSWLPPCYNAQCIFNQETGNKGRQFSIDFALEFLKIESKIDRHDALNDAWYTAKIMEKLDIKKGIELYDERTLYISNISRTGKDGSSATFDGYASMPEVIMDKHMIKTRCSRCKKMLSMGKLVQNGESSYVSVSKCDECGDYLVKFQIELAEDNKYCVKKTVHRVQEEDKNEVFVKIKKWSRARQSLLKKNK